MKVLKKVMTAIAVAVIGTVVFAQPVSFTNLTTFGSFTTDVDNFMSVTKWSTVKPELGFGYIGYRNNVNSVDQFNFGFAKQFKDFYIGTYFAGELDGLTSTTTTVNDYKNSSWNTSSSEGFKGSVLVGFGNVGLKGSFNWVDATINHVTDGDGNENTTDIFDLDVDLDAGFITKLDDKPLEVSFNLGLDSGISKSYDELADTKQDNSNYIVGLGGASVWHFDTKELYQQKASLALVTNWTIPAVSVETAGVVMKSFGSYDNNIVLRPGYKLLFTPEEKLNFKVTLDLPMEFDFDGEADYADVDGTKVYNDNRLETATVSIHPVFNLGLQYYLLSNKVRFNAGMEFNTPTMRWITNTTKTRTDVSSKDVDTKTTTVTYDYLTSDMSVEFGSGFTAFLGKNISFDCSWNILGNLFNNFTSNVNEGNENFWNTVNRIFVHNISFLITAKF